VLSDYSALLLCIQSLNQFSNAEKATLIEEELYPMYLQNYDTECFSKKNFAENKLSPSLISLSLLFESHPSFLQQTLVQPSKFFLRKFSLGLE